MALFELDKGQNMSPLKQVLDYQSEESGEEKIGKIFMNNAELKNKIYVAISRVLNKKDYVSIVDVFIEIGVLTVEDYENWRFDRVPYLEKVCKVNLYKLSFIIREISAYAHQNYLKPSFTVYKQWGVKEKKILLSFSKSGNPYQEKVYSTHYVANTKKDLNTVSDFKLPTSGETG